MGASTAISLMDQMLQWRREYFAHSPAGAEFTDVDFVIASFLIDRLALDRVHVDNSAVQTLLADNAQARGRKFSIYGPDDSSAASMADKLTDLYLTSPGHLVPGSYYAGAAATGSIMLFYGLGAPWVGEMARKLPQLLGEDGLIVPLFGMAPGLWRAASCLVVRPNHRSAVMDILRELTVAFMCDDMDPLHLLEENLELRSQITRLQGPASGTEQIEQHKRTIAALEAELVSIRRAALKQEQIIAELTQ